MRTEQISSCKKYNVAFLRHGDKEIGGGFYSEFLLMKNLSKDKFNIKLLYSCDFELIELYRKEGVETIYIPLSRAITSIYKKDISYKLIDLSKYLWHMIIGIIIIKRSINENNIDLLVLCDNLSKIIGSIAAKISGIKVIAYSRDTFVENFIGKVLRFFSLNFSDKIIAVSDETARFLKVNSKKGKVVTIHNGVEIRQFNPDRATSLRNNLKIDNHEIVIGCIAVFMEYKGHIYLLRAIKQLQSLGVNNLTCLLIGKGDLENQLKLFVNEEKLTDIRFLGFRRDIPDLLKTMDVLVLPSISVEGFPRVVIEAMAMKLPVVGTTVGGVPEAVDNGKTGMLVPPQDADSLSKAIKYLIDNPEARKKMGESGRRKVEEKFSIESIIRETEKLYLDVLQNS